MKVSCRPGQSEFGVASWSSNKPEHVIAFLSKQLEAAKVVWPEELRDFSIHEHKHRPQDDNIPY